MKDTTKIKFRVWDAKRKKFFDPSKYTSQSGSYAIDETGALLAICENYEGASICPADDDLYKKEPRFIYTLSTGFLDIHGKEVYDGDLIKGDGYGPYRVFWEGGAWCSCCYSDAERIGKYSTIEVISNIFETEEYEGQQ